MGRQMPWQKIQQPLPSVGAIDVRNLKAGGGWSRRANLCYARYPRKHISKTSKNTDTEN